MIFINDASGQTILTGPEWVRLTGQPLDQSLGRNWLNRIYRDDRAMVEDTHNRAVETASEYGMGYRLLRPDGSHRWVRIGAQPSFGPPDRTFLGFIGSLVAMPESDRNRPYASIGRTPPRAAARTGGGLEGSGPTGGDSSSVDLSSGDLDRIADHMLAALTLIEKHRVTAALPGIRHSLYEVGRALAAQAVRYDGLN